MIRSWLKYIALALLVSLPGFKAFGETPAEKRPNVVLVLVDDQGYGDLSCHGNPVLKTPNMDRLAAQGVELTDFHVSPLCSPTRAALMTGRHCRKVGVQGTNGTDQHLAADAVSMANLFASNGYATGIFGKWHLGDRYPLRPMDRGFAESVVFPDGAVSTVPDFWGNRYFNDTYVHNGKQEKYEGYCTEVWFREATRFIEANKDRPFFCYVPTNAAHAPFLVPEKFKAPYLNEKPVSVPAFYGMIANLDENIGQFRKRLEELGLEKNTIFIFMTDNGTQAGTFNAGMRGIKASPYDGGHRVPCFIHYPNGGLTGGRKVEQLSAHIDMLPTLVDLCGLKGEPKLPTFDGISLKKSLAGEGAVDENRVLIESFRGVVLTRRWRLVNERELYDIQKDPAQKNNVALEFPDETIELARLLREYRKTEDLRPHSIVIGSKAENPVTLTGEDWQTEPLIYQRSVADLRIHDPATMVWKVNVAEAGRYKIALRRWPRETATPLNSPLPKEKWCHNMTRCAQFRAAKASLRVGDTEHEQAVNDTTQEAEFTVSLAAGNTTLQCWFTDRSKRDWVAYYVYAERLDDAAP